MIIRNIPIIFTAKEAAIEVAKALQKGEVDEREYKVVKKGDGYVIHVYDDRQNRRKP